MGIKTNEAEKLLFKFRDPNKFESTASSILFDNTRFRTGRLRGDLPNFESRNLDSQYWIFWPREAASKGIDKGLDYESVAQWDSAFNLTVSIRRDSDIIRPFGDKNIALRKSRYANGKLIPFDKAMERLLANKINPNGKHTAWIVSNCNRTNGARARSKYAQRPGFIFIKYYSNRVYPRICHHPIC